MLEAIRLTRTVDDGVTLLDEVTLEIAPGDRVALSGPSGSGKTVLMRALALLDTVDSGEIRWKGEPIADQDVPAYRGQLLYLQQQTSLAEGTVESNLRAPFEFGLRKDTEFDAERARGLLERIDRGQLFEQSTDDLSGGERQLVVLVRALLVEPQMLLLDEPTAALDDATQSEAERLVTAWLEENDDRAVLWTSHDTSQLERVTHRWLTIDGGRLSEGRGGTDGDAGGGTDSGSGTTNASNGDGGKDGAGQAIRDAAGKDGNA